VFGLITELDHHVVRGRHFELADLALKGFAMASACINPLLYCWLNENLRRNITTLSFRLNPFHRISRRQNRSLNGGAASDAPGGARMGGDLPRFNIQPPSCCSNGAANTAGPGCGTLVHLEVSQSTAVVSDCPRRTSLLAILEQPPLSVSHTTRLASPDRVLAKQTIKRENSAL